jgi:hypothetical protein
MAAGESSGLAVIDAFWLLSAHASAVSACYIDADLRMSDTNIFLNSSKFTLQQKRERSIEQIHQQHRGQ